MIKKKPSPPTKLLNTARSHHGLPSSGSMNENTRPTVQREIIAGLNWMILSIF